MELKEKEKHPEVSKGTPSKKEVKKAEQEKNVREEKGEKESMNVSKYSSKGDKVSPVKKEKIKTEKQTTAQEVTPQKSAKEDSQPVDTTPQDEKKKAARDSYLKFLKRSGPANPGSKSIPEVNLISFPFQ